MQNHPPRNLTVNENCEIVQCSQCCDELLKTAKLHIQAEKYMHSNSFKACFIPNDVKTQNETSWSCRFLRKRLIASMNSFQLACVFFSDCQDIV